MNIKELKEIIKNLPDDMNYSLKKEDFVIEDYWAFDREDDEPKGKMLFIHFENKLNENPI